MITVWYPFSDDHRYAGKFYEGRMPDGDVDTLLKLSGARKTAPSADKIVTPEQCLEDELADFDEDWAAMVEDIETYATARRAARARREVEAKRNAVQRLLDAGEVERARLAMSELEHSAETIENEMEDVLRQANVMRVAMMQTQADGGGDG